MTDNPSRTVAVIGAGVAGSACARALHASGHRVTVFDRSNSVGGRMASCHARCGDAAGRVHQVQFDHGVANFGTGSARFSEALARAQAAGVLLRWTPLVFSDDLSPMPGESFVARPDMPALCRSWLAALPLRLGQPVQRLQRGAAGWRLLGEGGAAPGLFDRVVLALPPAQASALLAEHHADQARALRSIRLQPCWTLMAVTDDVDWPWDAAEPARGPLAFVMRNDRLPGRTAPPGCAVWVAHARASWSAAHLDEPAAAVADALGIALQSLLPPAGAGAPRRWHHLAVHRWRDAFAGASAHARPWWDAALGLGACGDALGGGGVEGAWRSGVELAALMAAERQPSHATDAA